MRIERAVFDTNILIGFSRRSPRELDVMRQVRERYISIVTWVEFLTGIAPPEEETARAFLDETFEIIDADRETYEVALELRRTNRLKLPDALIYATAQELAVPLITLNTKDFDPGWSDVYVP